MQNQTAHLSKEQQIANIKYLIAKKKHGVHYCNRHINLIEHDRSGLIRELQKLISILEVLNEDLTSLEN